MPTYKLTYFNGRGRAELSRMLFGVKGQAFTDERLEFAQWPDRKAGTPQGSLPVLEIDGKTKICQSFAIARYLAREFGMNGTSNLETAIIDQILDTLLDLFTPYATYTFGSFSEEEKKDMGQKFENETLPKQLGFLENLVSGDKTKCTAVGKSLTVADLALYVYIENCNALEKVPKEKYPRLAANLAATAKDSKVAAYIKSRPKNLF